MAKEIEFSEEALEFMEERGIRKEDVVEAVEAAENGGDKLYTECGNFLAKATVGNYTVYVGYKESGDSLLVGNAYGHRVTIVEYEG